MSGHIGVEVIFPGIVFIVFLVVYSRHSAVTKEIGMKHYKGYQEYGMAAKGFFDEVKSAFQNHFRYPFDRECPNYYFAKIYDDDLRYILVIDLGNLSAAAIINEFQFTPKSRDIRFADERTDRTLNWVTGKKFYVYQNGSWEMVSELERNDMLDMLMDWEMEKEIDLEHAYTLSYPDAGTAARTETALCQAAAAKFALKIAEKAGIPLKFKEEQAY